MISSISVHAASVPGQYDVIDLLATGFFPDGDLSVTKTASLYTFSWEVTAVSSLNYVYINVYSPTAPSSIKLNSVSGTLVYSGAFYQYRFLMNRVLSDCTVTVNFSSSSYRTVSIGYAVGTVSGQAVFDTCTVKSKGVNATSYSVVDDAKIPYKGLYSSTVTSNLTPAQITSKFELVFQSPLASADYATFHLIIPSAASSYPPQVTLYPFFEEPSFFLGVSAAHTYPLNIISVDSYNDPVRGLGSISSAWHYVVTVDVSGYKLDSLDIVCDFSVFGVKKGDTDSYSFGFELLSSCVGLYPDSGSFFRGFIPWLNTQFSNIKSAIMSLGTTITTQFSQLKTSLSGWFTALGNKIEAAINPTPKQDTTDSQDGVSDGLGAMEQFEQDGFGKIENGMSSMETDISTGVKSFLPALSFIRKYTDHVASGISDYLLVFTLPIFVGLFLFICNRLPGVTRFGSSRPKKED